MEIVKDRGRPRAREQREETRTLVVPLGTVASPERELCIRMLTWKGIKGKYNEGDILCPSGLGLGEKASNLSGSSGIQCSQSVFAGKPADLSLFHQSGAQKSSSA